MVSLQLFVPEVIIDLKYATKNNFTGNILYNHPHPFLRLEAAIRLKKVNQELVASGFKIKVFDAYRPWNATNKMWKLVHDERYAANPSKGSGHNRGAAVDLTLVKISSNEEVEMPTAFDDFSEKAHHSYLKLSKEVIENRSLLRRVMEKNGFVALETEWWHYSLPEASKKYELLNLDFKKMKKITDEQ